MKQFLPLFLLGFLFAALTAEEITIDPARAVISAPKANDPAAQELKLHIELITGKTIPVIGIGHDHKDGFVFHIGKVPADATAKFQPEEARWKITRQTAYFYGANPRGALFAVYDFLENELGVRWPGDTDIAVRKQDPIRVNNTAGQWIPGLNQRGIRYGGKAHPNAGLWRRRLRVGGHDAPVYGHAFTQYWKRFGKTHPDFFAMRRDGVRAPAEARVNANDAAAFTGPKAERVSMCVSNPELVKQVIADWKAAGCRPYINLCENDAYGTNVCQCAQCRALDVVPKQKGKWENWYADRYILFANRVLTEAKKIRPDVKAAMYAYNATEQAPAREKPLPDLVIGIVPTDFTMAGIQSYVGAWKKAGLNHFFYRPNRHHYYNLPQLPVGYEKHFFEVWQYLYRSGAIGFDYDASAETGAFQFFSNYVLLKAMQDPSKPFAYWENHYLRSFGAAQEDIRQYFRYWREEVWERRIAPHQAEIAEKGKWFNFARGLVWNLGKYYRESDFIEAGKHLEAALSRSLMPEERVRIEKLRLGNEHARLFFNAVVNKKDADSLKLLAFREKYKIPLLQWNEQHFGDVCGIKRVMTFREYKPPYLKTPLFWNFRLDPENRGIAEKWYELTPAQVRAWGTLMYTNIPWEALEKRCKELTAAIQKETAHLRAVAWYGTQMKIPADWKDRKIFLYFGAVDESCRVYVNGKEIGPQLRKQDGPLAVQIDSAVDWNRNQQNFIVRVELAPILGGIRKPVWLVSK